MQNRLILGALCALLLATFSSAATPLAAQPEECTATLDPGASVGEAVRRAVPGSAICLRPGIYGPVYVGAEVPAGVTVRGVSDGVNIAGTRSQPALSVEADGFTLTDVVVRGGVPATVHAVEAERLALRNVRVEGAAVGILLESAANARLDGVVVNAPLDAGLVAWRGASVIAERLTIVGGGFGVAALPDGTRLTLRGGRIAGSAGPAIFAGALGCADIPAGTVVVPRCYYEDVAEYIGDVRLVLEDVTVDDGPGAGVVLHPGTDAQIRRTGVYGRERGGVLAWGAGLALTDSIVEANREFGVAVRAYPHAGVAGVPPAVAQITRTTVRSTRSLSEGIGGNAIVARGAAVSVLESTLVWNAAAGVLITDLSSGDIRRNEVVDNRGMAICVSADSTVTESENRLAGNQTDAVLTCADGTGDHGGRTAVGPAGRD
jgi:hypothetical protein